MLQTIGKSSILRIQPRIFHAGIVYNRSRFQSTTASSTGSAPSESAAATADVIVDKSVEVTTGILKEKPNELLAYYNRLFLPSGQFGRFGMLIPPFIYRRSSKSVLHQIQRSIPSSSPLKILEYVPREREGGAFVRFELPPSDLTRAQASEALSEGLRAKSGIWGGMIFKRNVFPVMGTPWLEDMRRDYTTTLKVAFDGPDVSQEDLYSTLRRYGRIHDINHTGVVGKDTMRSAEVVYNSFIDAATARNCANGQMIKGTKIHVSFILKAPKTSVFSWFTQHPRISLPILIALVAGLAYVIFEPIRVFNVERKLTGTFLSERFSYLNSFWHSTKEYLSVANIWQYFHTHQQDDADISFSWDQIKAASDRLEKLLKEGADTFIIVSGPRGSAQPDIVTPVCKDLQRPVLELDFDAILKTKNDNQFISALTGMLGYSPVFLWTNTMSKFVDLATTSLAGQSSGFSETMEQQCRRILNTAAIAIRETALTKKPSTTDETTYLQDHPELIPVIIIKNFKGDSGFFSKLLSEWAGGLVASNSAQIVFSTSDIGYDKVLTDALPNRLFEVIAMEDVTAETARQYFIDYMKVRIDSRKNHKQTEAFEGEQAKLISTLDELEKSSASVFQPLGGRLTDLQGYLRRIMAGETLEAAMLAMIDQSAAEVSQRFLSGQFSEWTPEQAWEVILQLANNKANEWSALDTGLYNKSLFASEKQREALKALEARELIASKTVAGRLALIKPASPLYQSAFQKLVNDDVVNSLMEVKVCKASIKAEEAKIKDFETELNALATLPARYETKQRQDYLASKLLQSQEKVNAAEAKAKKRLADYNKLQNSRK